MTDDELLEQAKRIIHTTTEARRKIEDWERNRLQGLRTQLGQRIGFLENYARRAAPELEQVAGKPGIRVTLPTGLTRPGRVEYGAALRNDQADNGQIVVRYAPGLVAAEGVEVTREARAVGVYEPADFTQSLVDTLLHDFLRRAASEHWSTPSSGPADGRWGVPIGFE